MDLWLNGSEMASNHVPTWVRNVQVEKAPKVSIIVSLTQKVCKNMSKIAKKGENGLKTAKHYLCMAPTNIKHLQYFLGHFSINMSPMSWTQGHNGCFGVKTPLSQELSGEGLNGPKVVKHAWHHCVISREGICWWHDHSRAALRHLCYFLPVAIFHLQNSHFQTPTTPDGCLEKA